MAGGEEEEAGGKLADWRLPNHTREVNPIIFTQLHRGRGGAYKTMIPHSYLCVCVLLTAQSTIFSTTAQKLYSQVIRMTRVECETN